MKCDLESSVNYTFDHFHFFQMYSNSIYVELFFMGSSVSVCMVLCLFLAIKNRSLFI